MITQVLLVVAVYTHASDIPFDGLYSIRAPSGRIIVSHPPVNLTLLNPLMRARMESISAIDAANDMYTPLLENMNASTYEMVPEFGRIELGDLIRSSADVVEYAVRDYTNLKLRYMHDCESSGDVHPSLKLFWYAEEALRTGMNLTEIPLFVSPPVLIPWFDSNNAKARFTLTDEAQDICRLGESSVRFMLISTRPVSEDIRITMRADLRMPRTHRYILAMHLGIKLIRHLQLLHSRNILHGDSHPAYARIFKIPQGVQFVLDNVGASSSWILPDGTSERPVIPSHAPTYLSPWEIINKSYTKRDEVFRAILTVANWVCYYDYEVMQSIMSTDVMVNWKLYGNIFVVPEKNGVGVALDPLRELPIPAESIEYIRECLERIMSLARNDDIANPQYDLLIREMHNIAGEIMEPKKVVTKKRKIGSE